MERKNECNKISEIQQDKNHIEDLSLGFINIKNIANYLGIKTSTLYSMVEEKRVPHYRIGRLIRFKKSEIDEWMRGQKEPVIDVRVEAKKVIRSVEKKVDLDVNRIIKKAVDEVKGKRYNSHQGKPDRIKGLRKEVDHGAI